MLCNPTKLKAWYLNINENILKVYYIQPNEFQCGLKSKKGLEKEMPLLGELKQNETETSYKQGYKRKTCLLIDMSV